MQQYVQKSSTTIFPESSSLNFKGNELNHLWFGGNSFT